MAIEARYTTDDLSVVGPVHDDRMKVLMQAAYASKPVSLDGSQVYMAVECEQDPEYSEPHVRVQLIPVEYPADAATQVRLASLHRKQHNVIAARHAMRR